MMVPSIVTEAFVPLTAATPATANIPCHDHRHRRHRRRRRRRHRHRHRHRRHTLPIGTSSSARSTRCHRFQRSSTHTSKRTHPTRNVTTCAVSRSCARRCRNSHMIYLLQFFNFVFMLYVVLWLCLCERHTWVCSQGHRLSVTTCRCSNPLLVLTLPEKQHHPNSLLYFSIERFPTYMCRSPRGLASQR